MPWEITLNDAEILAVHAGVLPDGRILYFGGSEHNMSQNQSGDAADLDNTRIYDPDDPAAVTTIASPDTDVFCAGHSILSDGRLLVAGGTEEWGSGAGHGDHVHTLNFLGERAAWIYSPRANRWDRVADMSFEPGTSAGGGRWYPTLVTLPNGQSMAIAGHPRESDTRHNNDTPERYNPASNTWTQLAATRIAAGDRGKYYPRVHVLPDGSVFFSTPSGGNCRLYDPVAGAWQGSPLPTAGAGLYDSGWDFASVLLPLLPGDDYRARVLVTGDVQPRIIDPTAPGATWSDAGSRDFAGSAPRRRFGCAVLLPTGQVFLAGGINSLGSSDADAERRGELYSPGVNWDAGGSHTGAGTWDTVESAAVTRNYHSTALLQPDGRVWTAGSSKNAAEGHPSSVAELRVEVYKPPYDGDANRPVLSGAPRSVGYGQQFAVQCDRTDEIQRVAFMRAGSVTHAFDADQRYVGATFAVEGEQLIVESPPHSAVAPPGHYMLWAVTDDGLPCVRAPIVRVCDQRVIVITDRSTFSTHEVEALGTPASFRNAFYVTLDGFLPTEVGTPPSPPQFQFRWADGGSVPGLRAAIDRVEYEDPAVPPDIAQRITFVCTIVFDDATAFGQIPAAEDARDVLMVVEHGANTEVAPLRLTKNPNPYMRDGQTHWLSTDLRVFALNEGTPFSGLTLGAGGPLTFLESLLAQFNALPTDEDHPFFDISTDSEESQLYAARLRGGQPVHNFAVAKVRLRAPTGVDADDVRVFFRMFRTVATGFAYEPATYPRLGDGATAVPMLGRNAGEVASIPFFAEPRVSNLADHDDPLNRQTIAGNGATEVTAYFGCWLDFNQPTPRFPLAPPHDGRDGPFTSGLLSLQELLRNHHCCLVAEVHYPPDPIPTGTTPGAHENLAQRNLVVVASDNPGTAATHTVQSTFEVKPSKLPLIVRRAFGQSPIAEDAVAVQLDALGVGADELLIRWGTLPRDSRVTLFLPGVDVHQVAAAAGQRNGPVRLQARDSNELVCTVGDHTWIPLPGPGAQDFAGLLTIELPPTVTKGQHFSFSVHQVTSDLFAIRGKVGRGMLAEQPVAAAVAVSGRRRGYRRITGAFAFDIPVHHASEIVSFDLDRLAVTKHIAGTIPAGNKWEPVFARLVAQIGDRVRGFGTDPTDVPASGDGGGPNARPDEGDGPKPPHDGDDTDRGAVTGMVQAIEYDRCGRIQAVTVIDCDERTRVPVCEHGLAELLERACRHGLRVKIILLDGCVRRVDMICC